MNPPRPCRQVRRLWMAGLTLLMAGVAHAEPARLTIGQGWAWVRESFPPSGERDIETLRWETAPAEMDLNTLQVWSIRRPWPMREWNRESPATLSPDESPPLVWRPGAAPAVPPVQSPLVIRLERPMSHRMGHSLTYRLPGLTWEIFYRVVVRGIGPESIGAVQVDVLAYAHIHNDTATPFRDARISLIGIDPYLAPPAKPFGRLDVNPDTPLSDLWLALRDPVPLLPQHYPLQTPAHLPAKGVAEVRFAQVDRKPARIVHISDSREIPAPTQRGGLPLRRMLRIANTAAVGLGFPLPPGEADLFLGTVRGAPVQSGHVFHTPYPGVLQIDMGTTESVRATRQSGEEMPLPEGGSQSDHTVTLVNRLSSPVQVEVIERPETPLSWSLVRSSLPAAESSRTLQFDVTIPPHASHTISYRLRLSPQTL